MAITEANFYNIIFRFIVNNYNKFYQRKIYVYIDEIVNIPECIITLLIVNYYYYTDYN